MNEPRSFKMKYSVVIIISILTFCLSGLKAQDSTLTKLRRANLSHRHYENGVSYFNQRSYEKATEEFELAISLNAVDHLFYYFNGLSYERLGRLTKALLNYNLSLSIQPDFTEALFNRAIVSYKLEKYKDALEDFEQLLKLPPGETQAVYFRGIKYGEDDKDPGFNEVISMTNKEADIYNYMGLCYYHLGLYNQSKLQYAEAIKRNPEDDNIQVNAGLTCLATGDTDSARIHFQRSLSINPYNTVAQLNLSLCYPESVDVQIQQLNQLILENREFPMAYAQRAYQYYLAGNYNSAISDYDSAIMLDPDNPVYILERGILYERMNEIDRAIDDFNAALLLDENNDQVWYNLANAFFLKSDYEASIEYYSQAISLNPSKPDLYYNRSLAYFYLKKIEKACIDMRKAQSLGNRKTSHFISTHCQ
jgi:tetratricopeptide (TPR) repeat protein